MLKHQGHQMQNQTACKAIKPHAQTKQNALWFMVNQLPRLSGPLALLLTLLIGVMMSTLTTHATAAEHIKVTKEVLLEEGVQTEPSSIIQVKDGGYVITGKMGLGWATRVDANGTMRWRYQIPILGQSNYTGAVSLSDDTTLLCGYKAIAVTGGESIAGILTHIDKTGKVLSERVLRPQEEGAFGGSYLKGCMPWGNGFALYGVTDRASGPPVPPRTIERFYWLLALDAKGEVKWQKLLPTKYDVDPKSVYIASDQSIVIDPVNGITQSGERTKVVPDASGATAYDHLIHPITTGSDRRWKIDPNLIPLKSDLKYDVSKTKLRTNIAYSLPDRSLVQFGSVTRGHVYYAAIDWQSPDRKQLETFEFGETLWVDDAIPTGNPGEFVTVRLVNGSVNKRVGMVLSFIQIK